MANYSGTERSNYVRFKPESVETVKAYCAEFGVQLVPHAQDALLMALLPSFNSDDGCFPTSTFREILDDEGDMIDEVEVEFDLGEIACHMEEGQVLVSMHAGAEKLRYVSGYSQAWDWRGNHVSLCLNDIFDRAAEAFDVPRSQITDASY